jgi:hypothetical protein
VHNESIRCRHQDDGEENNCEGADVHCGLINSDVTTYQLHHSWILTVEVVNYPRPTKREMHQEHCDN